MLNLWLKLKIRIKGIQKEKQKQDPLKLINQQQNRKPTSKVKKEVNAIDGGAGVDLGGLTPDEQEMLESLTATGESEMDTVDDTTEGTSEEV